MLFCLIFFSLCELSLISADFMQKRKDFIQNEEKRALGSSLILNEKEQIVNEHLMKDKLAEYDAGFYNPKVFLPRRHFFEAKSDIEKSRVFKFIQKMPKGGALHGHDTALVSEEYLYNLTYEDNLHACTVNNRLQLKFLKTPNQDKACKWTLLKTLRQTNASYDSWVRSQLTLNVQNPKRKYPDINAVWKTMSDIFKTVTPMLTYKPIFQKHFYQSLKELYEDNVIYLEFRGTLPDLYALNGTIYTYNETIKTYQETIISFKKDYPSFYGAKFIYAPSRKVNDTVMNDVYMKMLRDLDRNYEIFAGFDLVGQEDLGRPLSDFAAQLRSIPKHIKVFYHAGETNWYGTSTDFNLIDAILLGTKRIGHGYGITKHPLVMKAIKEKDIAIEVCPISNQVLMLVEDLRNHPAAALMAKGLPVVISYDDPTFWSSKGLSYDFYMAFMGIASRNADLRLLKQLSLNSLHYSALKNNEMITALNLFHIQWNTFIDQIYDSLDVNSENCIYVNWQLMFVLTTTLLYVY